ncbi:hypothetical protein MKX03_005048 [Papaver bracteatum]|nr:hypothetical protein MKX03_005048 [Papaver bracteatum]
MVVLYEEVQRVVDLVVLLELYSIYVALTAMALGSHKAREWASQLGCLAVFLEGCPRDVIVKHFITHKEFFGSSPMKCTCTNIKLLYIWKSVFAMLVEFTNDQTPS